MELLNLIIKDNFSDAEQHPIYYNSVLTVLSRPAKIRFSRLRGSKFRLLQKPNQPVFLHLPLIRSIASVAMRLPKIR